MNKIIGLVILWAVVAVVIGPICVIWAINTLFTGITIPYTIETWCAAAILCNIFRVTVNKKD
jgi:hypothetical protein